MMSTLICRPGRFTRYVSLAAILLGTGLHSSAQCPSAAAPFDVARGGIMATSNALLASQPGSVYVQDGGLDLNANSTTTIAGDVYINGDLRINNGSGITVENAGRLFVYGNVYILAGATLTINTGGNVYSYGEQWTVAPGAIVNNTGSAGAVSFIMPRPAAGASDAVSGSNRYPGNATAYTTTANTAQFLDGGGVDMAVNLVQANANNLVLCNLDNSAATGSGDTRLSGILSFTKANGDVLLQDNNLVFSATGSYAANGINPYQAYLVSNGAGSVVKDGIGNGVAFTFPVGQAEGDYTPAAVTNNAGVTNGYTVQVKTYANSGAAIGAPAEGMDRAWRIVAAASGMADVCLVHNSVTNAAGAGTDGTAFDNAMAFVTQQNPSGVWSSGAAADGGSPISTHCGSFALATTAGAVNSFFSKSSAATPLPVTLTRFEGQVRHCEVRLQWTTAAAMHTERFVVEHGINGKNFEPVGTIPVGTASADYAFDYAGLAPGSNYFRLQLQDKDGKATYSNIIKLQADCGTQIRISPNPVQDYLVADGLTTGDEVVIASITGQRLYHATAKGSVLRIDIRNWTKGFYIVTVSRKQEVLKAEQVVRY